MKILSPRLCIGTMTFGNQTSYAAALEMLQLFRSKSTNADGKLEIDTARMYVHGKTEEMLGDLLNEEGIKGNYTLASKVNPFKGYNESLKPENVKIQMTEILKALKVSCVDILYLHAPDITTPIEETLQAVQMLYSEGKFKIFGLSNYAAWEVMYIHNFCVSNGWVRPSIYQGMYNAITRQVSMELLPCLRKLGIKFYAYNPLAGGLLTGKHDLHIPDESGRFSTVMYKKRYWNKAYFEACKIIQNALDDVETKTGTAMSMTEASLRWLMHHSELSALQDVVILGASRLTHLSQNLDACLNESPLPEPVVDAFEAAWDHVLHNGVVPKYFRP